MAHIPKLSAVFFRTFSGREPVRDWLRLLPKDERWEIGNDIAHVQYKWPLGKPRVDHIRGSIWEVRSRVDNRVARVLFAVANDEMVLLHGFIKKTSKTPNADITLAENRWKEWRNAER